MRRECFWLCFAGEKWRGRSIKNIVEEIEFLNKTNGAIFFKFIDDCWFGSAINSARAFDFCREIKKKKLKINFRLSCRSNNVDFNTFKELKRCGLFSLSLGVESVVARQLKEWRKGITVEQNLSALEICKKLGIIVQMGYIILDKDTTLVELKKHFNFLKKTIFAITKGIYSCIFIAEGTDLANEYKKCQQGDNNGKEKSGINLNYDFKYKEIKMFAGALKSWSKAHEGIYSRAIDPVSAPRAISSQSRQEIWKIIQELKKRDLEVFKKLLVFAEARKLSFMSDWVKKEIEKNRVFADEINRKLTDFYNKNQLVFEEKENIYIK